MSGTDDRALKRFSGEDDDPGRQLRKWRQWVQAKMYTMEKLTAKQQGPFLYTLLDGKALEAVEHLELSSIQVDDGADKILKILQERFPEKEAHDQMGEALGEVFGLAAREGETVQQWTARVAEVFTKCHRKADVKFPSPAQGWIALNCAGFSEEQKAIIKAKAQGKLDLEAVTSAMRSCFPLYKAGARARKPTATLVVEPAENPDSGDGLDDFADVEAFLADHNQRDTELEDAIPEDEAAEALAASWKERRAEIAKMRKERKFDSAQNSKKSFRVEIEELKRRTRCRKCGRIGHWARECRSSGSSASKPTSSSTTGAVEAQLVEQEVSLAQVDAVESVDVPEVMFVGMAQQAETQVLAAGLVSSPGYGVVDSGCGRTLIGMDTLEQLKNKLALVTAKKAEHYDTVSSFRFGNGATEVSEQAVKIPVRIGGVHGIIDAAIIKGRAPLLLGRPTLEKLRVSLDFAEKTMKFLRDQTTVPMQVNEAGQLLINVLDFPKGASQASVLQAQAQATQLCPDSVCHEQLSQCLTPPEPHPNSVSRVPRHPKSKKALKNKHAKCLLAQLKHLDASRSAQVSVAELFSPPRLTREAQAHGATGLAFDNKQGYDLGDAETQHEVEQLLEEARPELLTASPPCTPVSDNMCPRTPLERARLLRVNRQHIRFCAKQIHRQLARGGHFLLENPVGSRLWKDPQIEPLVNKYGVVRVDLCAYGLVCPRSGIPIKGSTLLLCSNPALAQGARTCPGCSQHQSVDRGTSPGFSRSSCSAARCPGFLGMLWKQIGSCPREVFVAQGESLDWEALDCECLAGAARPARLRPEAPAREDPNLPNEPQQAADPQLVQRVDQALQKLHNNLGHPSAKELTRILKHSGASGLALQRVSALECSVCANQSRPTAPLPANATVVTEFNDKVGLDVKYVPGWKPRQKVPCVNVVDFATSMQVFVPLTRVETGETVREALRAHWVSWAGPPKTLTLKP